MRPCPTHEHCTSHKPSRGSRTTKPRPDALQISSGCITSLLSVEEIAQGINQAQEGIALWLREFNHMHYLEPSYTLFRVEPGAVLSLFVSGFDSF